LESINAKSAVLDGEILLWDTKNKIQLPFGTLGVHKQKEFKDATVAIFFFDILYLEGRTLLNIDLVKRRKILEKVLKPIPDRIFLSEYVGKLKLILKI
jgi:DNA ligase 3